jgi:hypothetical protein
MATRNVDWAGLTNKVKGDAARSEIGRMRQLMDQIKGENAGVSSEVPAIDFDAYRGKIKSPGIVDAFESAYSKLSLPTFAASTADADAAFSALVRGAARSIHAVAAAAAPPAAATAADAAAADDDADAAVASWPITGHALARRGLRTARPRLVPQSRRVAQRRLRLRLRLRRHARLAGCSLRAPFYRAPYADPPPPSLSPLPPVR